MDILIVGSGGREHALAWKLREDPLVEKVYAAPGSDGIGLVADECVPIEATDIEGLARFAKEKDIDLTVVGPELPLALGIVDRFRALGLRIFGPTRYSALLETSKVHCKQFLQIEKIPTAPFFSTNFAYGAEQSIKERGVPVVVKPDGLTGGKGVFVCRTEGEALSAVGVIMTERRFGTAGDYVVVEDWLEGRECSFMVIVSGETIVPLLPSRDYKELYPGGPMTGGMGAYSPLPDVDETLYQEIMATIVTPTVKALVKHSWPYTGILYFGLMLTSDGPKVLEINCRFGDPETQAVLALLKSDLAGFLYAAAIGKLAPVPLEWRAGSAVCLVLASGGYPAKSETDSKIMGLSAAAQISGVTIFHAGTTSDCDGNFFTNGGRALNVVCAGPHLQEARYFANQAADQIYFAGKQLRSDVGWR